MFFFTASEQFLMQLSNAVLFWVVLGQTLQSVLWRKPGFGAGAFASVAAVIPVLKLVATRLPKRLLRAMLQRCNFLLLLIRLMIFHPIVRS